MRTQGLQRQYHGKGPHWKGSIALSQEVEAGGEGGRTEAGEASQEVAPCQSQEMPFFCTVGQLASAQALSSQGLQPSEMSREGRQGVTTKEFRFLCWEGTAGWVQNLPLGRRGWERP